VVILNHIHTNNHDILLSFYKSLNISNKLFYLFLLNNLKNILSNQRTLG